MSKKTAVLLAAGILAVLLIASAGLAGAQTGDDSLESLYRQIYELRRQVVEKRVESGSLTPEQGNQILQRMAERRQDCAERLEAGLCEPGAGAGSCGGGCGMRAGQNGSNGPNGFRGCCGK